MKVENYGNFSGKISRKFSGKKYEIFRTHNTTQQRISTSIRRCNSIRFGLANRFKSLFPITSGKSVYFASVNVKTHISTIIWPIFTQLYPYHYWPWGSVLLWWHAIPCVLRVLWITSHLSITFGIHRYAPQMKHNQSYTPHDSMTEIWSDCLANRQHQTGHHWPEAKSDVSLYCQNRTSAAVISMTATCPHNADGGL